MDLFNALPGLGSNPFDASMLALSAANDPNSAAAVMASMGQPPPSQGGIGFDIGAKLGSFFAPQNAGIAPTQGPGLFASGAINPAAITSMGQPATGGAMPAVVPAPAGPVVAGAAPGLGSMQGVKGPMQAAPIMSGGVNGPPVPKQEFSGSAAAGNQMMQVIQALLSKTPQATPAKPLGEYF